MKKNRIDEGKILNDISKKTENIKDIKQVSNIKDTNDISNIKVTKGVSDIETKEISNIKESKDVSNIKNTKDISINDRFNIEDILSIINKKEADLIRQIIDDKQAEELSRRVREILELNHNQIISDKDIRRVEGLMVAIESYHPPTKVIPGNTPSDENTTPQEEDKKESIDNKIVINNGKHLIINNTSIVNGFYEYNSTIEVIELSDSVKEIGEFAFYNCENLKEIVFGNGIVKIGRSAFQNCKSITKVSLPNGLKVIEPWTFAGCTALNEVSLGDAVTEIGHQAFAWCKKLNNLTVLSPKIKLGLEVFYNVFKQGSNTNTIYLPHTCTLNSIFGDEEKQLDAFTPENLRYIWFQGIKYQDSASANSGNQTLTVSNNKKFEGMANIPAQIEFNGRKWTVTEITSNAFEGSTGLTSVVIPETVTKIGEKAFTSCKRLTTIIVNNSNPNYRTDLSNRALISIGNNGNTSSLLAYAIGSDGETFTIPKDVSIGNSAFAGFSKLRSITFLTTKPPSIGSKAFDGGNCEKCFVYVPRGKSLEYHKELKGWWSIDNIIDSGIITDEQGIEYQLTNDDKKTVEVINGKEASNDVIIPESVQYAESLYTVVKIISEAFAYNDLITSVEIPKTVTEIEELAFYNNISLRNFNVAGDNLYYKSENGVLFNKDQTHLIRYPQNKSQPRIRGKEFEELLESRDEKSDFRKLRPELGDTKPGKGGFIFLPYKIPNTVVKIENFAFADCSLLTSVTIPNSVKEIGRSAFSFCEGLTSISIPNSVKTINEYTFERCFGLTSISLPNSVTTIANEAFEGCCSLVSIYLPSSVTRIGYWDLTDYDDLKKIVCEAVSPPVAGWFGSMDYDSCIVKVPRGSVGIYKKAEGWNLFKKNIVENNPKPSSSNYYTKVDGIAYSILSYEEKTARVASNRYFYANGGKAIIKDKVTINGENYNVIQISKKAFWKNKRLKSVSIPASIKTICYGSFWYCDNCNTIKVPRYTEIEKKAFVGTNYRLIVRIVQEKQT